MESEPIALTCAAWPAAAQTSPVPVPGAGGGAAPKFTPAPDYVFVLIFAVTVLAFAAAIVWLATVLYRDKDWNIGDAISGSDGKPSASRLIAVLGMIAIVAVMFGVTLSAIWVFLTTGQWPSLSGATTFLAACAGLFTPYLASQIGQAFGAQPAQALAPVVMQSAGTTPLPVPPGTAGVVFGAPVKPPGT